MKQGWEIKKLGDICDVVGGSTPKTSEDSYWGGEHYWISPAELDGSKYVYSTSRTITDEGVKSAHLQILPIGTVLLSSRAPIGKVAITKVPMFCNQGFKNIICKDEVINEFVYWFLLYSTDYLKTLGTGATFKEISKKVVEQVSIPVPPFSEQEKIVAELDCLSSIIEKKKQQLKEYDALAQSIFYEMFGDPVENEKGWDTKRVEEICDVYRGGSPRPIEKFLGGNIPWIKIGDATQGDSIYLTKTKEHIIEEGLKKTRYINSGSLIFANCGVSLGFARIITFDGCIHDGWLALDNVSNEVEKIFFLKSINFCTKYFRSIAPDGVQPNLNTTIMKTFKQILPPLELQKRFVEIIQSIENQKQLVAKSLAEVETLFNSRMDYYFN